MSDLQYDGLSVYLPDQIRAQVDALAASRGLSAQELLDAELAAHRLRLRSEFEAQARVILEHGQGWPSDPLEALLVGALHAFILVEASDVATGRFLSNPHYLKVIFPDHQEEWLERQESAGFNKQQLVGVALEEFLQSTSTEELCRRVRVGLLSSDQKLVLMALEEFIERHRTEFA